MASPYPWHYTLRWPIYFHWPSTKNHSGIEPQLAQYHFHPYDEKNNTRLLFCGDIMVLNQDTIPQLHPELCQLIQNSDLFIGNCEAPVGLQDINPKQKYRFSFHMPKEILRNIIQQTGLPPKQWVLTNANNHSGDRGYNACVDSYDILHDMGINTVGRWHPKNLPIKIIAYGPIKIGFVAWTHWMNNDIFNGDQGVNRVKHIINYPWATIKEKLNLSLLIGLPHWEYEFQHFPKNTTRGFAKYLIEDKGFDLILGSHPHTLQPLEKFNNGLCLYSLGNFCGLGIAWPVKLISLLEINYNYKLKKITSYRLHFFYQQHIDDNVSIIPLDNAYQTQQEPLIKRIQKMYLI